MTPLSVLFLASVPLLVPSSTAGSGQAAPLARTRLVFPESPAIDLYYHVRAAAAAGASGGHRIEALDPAIAAARSLDQALGGSPLAWGPLEGLLHGCKSAADIQKAFARVPEGMEVRGKRVELREPAAKLAAALVAAEPAFQEPMKRRSQRSAAARARWEGTVAPKWEQVIDFHLASLGMVDPELEIPVYLVAELPAPGAITHRDDSGEGVCFVGVDAAPGSQLFEIVLHEATHALDLATANQSALGEVRRALEAAGIPDTDRLARDLPHLLMFVQSAETIRRIVDPAHVDYGESARVYERMGPVVEGVRGYWRDMLDGKLTRDAALQEIVASVKPAPK